MTAKTNKPKASNYQPARIAAAAVGAVLLSLEAWTNVQATGGLQDLNPAVVAAGFISFAAGIAWPYAEMAWRARDRVNATLFAAGFVVATALCLANGIVVSSRETDGRIGVAEAGRKAGVDAKAAIEAAEADIKRVSPLRDAECKHPGPVCARHEAKIAADKAEIAAQQAKTAQAGKDLMAVGGEARISMLLGLPRDATMVVMLLPTLRPLTLILLGIAFVGVAFRHNGASPVAVRVAAAAPEVEAAPENEAERACRYLVRLLRAGGKVGSVTQLAAMVGCDIADASRAASRLAAEGVIRKHRDGKKVSLQLVA